MKITITRNNPKAFQESAYLIVEKLIKNQCVEALVLALTEGIEHFVLERDGERHSINVVLKGSTEIINNRGEYQ